MFVVLPDLDMAAISNYVEFIMVGFIVVGFIVAFLYLDMALGATESKVGVR